MNKLIATMTRTGFGFLPTPILGRLIGSYPRFIPYLHERDIEVRIANCYFGEARFWLNTRYRIEQLLMYTHAYDEKSLLSFMRVISSGDVCIDVGANIGAMTLSLAHRVGARGRVFAFEPGPLLFTRLRRNIEATGLSNVEAFQEGLGRTNEILFWALENGANAGNATVSERPTDTPCTIRSLDTHPACGGLARLDFIKIDVEGMELDVIEGGLALIRRHKPILLVETRTDDGPLTDTVSKLLRLLSDEGYEFWDLDVQRSDLEMCKPDFNFIECHLSTMPQNTLCVHRSKRFKLDRPNPQPVC